MRTETDLAPAPLVAEQFVSADQQREAVTFGMWIFLATEVLFFGGLIMLYTAYRAWYPLDFGAASRHLEIVLGTTNTSILILSSFLMAGAVNAVRLLEKRTAVVLLVLTALLGVLFLGIKGYEWRNAVHEGFWPGTNWFEAGDKPHGQRLFFSLYFVMTGVHGLHLLIGILLVLGTARRLARMHPFLPNKNTVALLGLYWHFVDIVWVFLFPLLYLIHRSGS